MQHVNRSFTKLKSLFWYPTDGCKVAVTQPLSTSVSFSKQSGQCSVLADRRKWDLGHFPHNISGSFAERFNRIFCQVALEKPFFLFFFCWGRFCSEIELLSAGELGSPCLDFKSLDALSFYETAEIGTLRAVGEYYQTIVQIVLHFFTILQRFPGFTRRLQNSRCVKKHTFRRNNEYLESRLLQCRRPTG